MKRHITSINETRRVCCNALQLFVLTFAIVAPVVTVRSQVLLNDGFETNAPGSFPAGWQLIYEGAGAAQQFVDTNQAASGGQSLHLLGSSCWGASAYRTIALPPKVRFRASVRVSGNLNGGCSPFGAGVSLYNPAINTWGTHYGSVGFSSDGFIYAVGDHYDLAGTMVSLQGYTLNVWYVIQCTVDLASRKVDIDIDGVRRATNISFTTNGVPTGIQLGEGHGDSPTAWFDDVLVEAVGEPPSTSALQIFPAVELVFGTESDRLYQLQYCTTIDTNTWHNLGDPMWGDGTVKSRFDGTRSSQQRFFRFVTLP